MPRQQPLPDPASALRWSGGQPGKAIGQRLPDHDEKHAAADGHPRSGMPRECGCLLKRGLLSFAALSGTAPNTPSRSPPNTPRTPAEHGPNTRSPVPSYPRRCYPGAWSCPTAVRVIIFAPRMIFIAATLTRNACSASAPVPDNCCPRRAHTECPALRSCARTRGGR